MKKQFKNLKVNRTLTLSKYYDGMHHFNPKEKGSPSFMESINPIHHIIEELFENGVPFGSSIEITMKVKKTVSS